MSEQENKEQKPFDHPDYHIGDYRVYQRFRSYGYLGYTRLCPIGLYRLGATYAVHKLRPIG